MSSCLAIARIDRNEVEELISGDTSLLGGLDQRQIDEYSSFDLGSITKVLSTTSILIKFLETERLGIDNKVSKFLPAWIKEKSQKLPYGTCFLITLGYLLGALSIFLAKLQMKCIATFPKLI
jgi:CubicO group peptidase (beta-lactamase class C family)